MRADNPHGFLGLTALALIVASLRADQWRKTRRGPKTVGKPSAARSGRDAGASASAPPGP
jgi:hypothetical protein